MDGADYHFTDRASFDAMVEEGRFAEWATVHGNRYGTSLDQLERARAERRVGIVFDIDYKARGRSRRRCPRR